MNNKKLMIKFIRALKYNKKLTLFIKDVFNYLELFDFNYIFRIREEEDRVIIDIYDNVSSNKFNRYVFIFKKGYYDYNVLRKNGIVITYINVYSVDNTINNILRLAYLFSISSDKMIEYANTFLDKEIVNILIKVIKKPILLW